MDWYFGPDDEDLTVPRDEEIFDRLPSPDSWPSWVNMFGSFNSQKKLNVSGVEEILSSEPMFYRHDFRQHSFCASDHSDLQLNDLPKIGEADDIFFDTLFEVDARELDGSEISSEITQTSGRNDVMAVDPSNRDSTNDVSHLSRFPPVKEMEAEIYMLEEQSDLCENISDYISVDEPVLHELQNLTQQLTETTRICFRDSFYRLAENSRYQTRCYQIGKEDLQDYKSNARVGPSRSQDIKVKELNTNAIDRTVATLLFTAINFCDSTATSTSGVVGETFQNEHQAYSCVHHLGSSTPSPCNVKGGDAEVPTMNRPLRQLSRTVF